LLQKLADLKEAARQAALARDEFVMPEGLSRKEQRTLLARHKRVRAELGFKGFRVWPVAQGAAHAAGRAQAGARCSAHAQAAEARCTGCNLLYRGLHGAASCAGHCNGQEAAGCQLLHGSNSNPASACVAHANGSQMDHAIILPDAPSATTLL
jgi:hypothetical protein